MKNELLDSESTETGNVLLQTLQSSSMLALRVCDDESGGAGRTAESLMEVLGITVRGDPSHVGAPLIPSRSSRPGIVPRDNQCVICVCVCAY